MTPTRPLFPRYRQILTALTDGPCFARDLVAQGIHRPGMALPNLIASGCVERMSVRDVPDRSKRGPRPVWRYAVTDEGRAVLESGVLPRKIPGQNWNAGTPLRKPIVRGGCVHRWTVATDFAQSALCQLCKATKEFRQPFPWEKKSALTRATIALRDREDDWMNFRHHPGTRDALQHDGNGTMRHLFTTADDAFIVANYATLTFGETAAALGRNYAGVQCRAARLVKLGQLDPHQRHYQRPWTEDDEDYVNDQWGKASDDEMVKHLNRSLTAIKLKAKRLGVNRRQNVWTATNVAELFGVDPKTVIRWLDRGWVQGKKGTFGAGGQRGEYRVWSLDEDSVERFVHSMGWAYDWRRMIEGEYLTRLARSLHKADPWLTLVECSKLIGYHEGTLARWTHEGMPHEHRPKQSQHGPIEGIVVVQRSALLAYVESRRAVVHRNRSESSRKRMLARYRSNEQEAA